MEIDFLNSKNKEKFKWKRYFAVNIPTCGLSFLIDGMIIPDDIHHYMFKKSNSYDIFIIGKNLHIFDNKSEAEAYCEFLNSPD